MGIGEKSVGIIGGTGRMGGWFSGFMEQCGMDVMKTGKKGPYTLEEVVGACSVVVISVPIKKTLSIIRRVGPLMSETSLLMDLTSVKEKPLDAMVSCSRSEVVGLHPLFGPDDATGQKRVVICKGRGERGMRWIRALLEGAGLETQMMDPAEHDRLMGLVQGANHLSTLALALSIRSSGMPLERLTQCATPAFKERLERIVKMLRQPSELFSSLLMENPYAAETLKEFSHSAEEWIDIVVRKDEKAFSELFHSLREY